MLPLRALVAPACLCSLALTACASTVPWPPPPGSCIEAIRQGRSKKARWRYRVDGHEATRADVERKVFATPELHEKARRYEKISFVAPILFTSGGPTTIAGGWAAGLSHHPVLLVISAVGFAATLTGFILGVTAEDPMRGAVNAYNEAARRQGLCRGNEPPPLAPPELWPAPAEPGPPPSPPEALPTLPSKGWKP